jgi:hypothetical protein
VSSLPLPRCLDDELTSNLPPELLRWQERRNELSYVYSRANGDVLQSGVARLTGMDEDYLELRSSGVTTLFVLRGARYGTRPQVFYGEGFLDAREVAGVSVMMGCGDWLFLCPRQERELVRHGHLQR